jgi:carbamoyltransferase
MRVCALWFARKRWGTTAHYDLVSAFHRKTGIPVILNTSFNENEPIVCTPEEAIDCFQRTRMDVLAIGPFMVVKPFRGDQETIAV